MKRKYSSSKSISYAARRIYLKVVITLIGSHTDLKKAYENSTTINKYIDNQIYSPFPLFIYVPAPCRIDTISLATLSALKTKGFKLLC